MDEEQFKELYPFWFPLEILTEFEKELKVPNLELLPETGRLIGEIEKPGQMRFLEEKVELYGKKLFEGGAEAISFFKKLGFVFQRRNKG